MLASRVAARSARVAAPRVSIAATRGFAEQAKPTAASSQQNVKPPVEVFGLDGTYASALVRTAKHPHTHTKIGKEGYLKRRNFWQLTKSEFKYMAAAKSSALDPIARALDSMHNTFQRDTKLQSILTAPTLSQSDKKQIVQELQKQTGVQDKTNTLTNFLATLAENNRLGVLEGVCQKFAVLMSAAKGELEMTITSAAPLEQKVVRQLEQAVSKSQYVGSGKKLKVVPKVRKFFALKCSIWRCAANQECLVQVNPDIRGGLIVEIGDRTIDLSVSGKMAKMNKLLQDTL